MPRKTIYLIDGHAQIFRAYYAPFGNLTSPSGEPTRAVHVFCQVLLNILKNRKPDYLAMVLDVSDETVFRKQLYPDYKAHRDPPPEDFEPQERRIIQILEAAAVPIIRMQGYEADDILATLAKRYVEAGHDVVLVSRDKDFEQLLNEHVVLYDPGKDEIITPARLLEIKGWRPDQALEAQTLIGDSVDNIPGVAGIGPKTAAKLIARYGSAKAVIEHADELTPRQRENVLAFAPKLELTRQLMSLRCDVPIELDLETAAPPRFTWAAVRPIFEQLGIKRLMDQLPGVRGAAADTAADATAASTPVAPAGGLRAVAATAPRRRGEGSLFPPGDAASASPQAEPAMTAKPEMTDAAPAFSAAPAARNISPLAPALIDRLRVPDGGRYGLIRSAEQFESFLAELTGRQSFAIDTETTNVNPIDAELVGLSFSWQAGHGAYIPLMSIYDGPLPLELVRSRLGPILADGRRTIVGHNIKYDLIVLENAGMPVRGSLFDTMIAAFVADPLRGVYGLDSLAGSVFGHEMIPITDLIGKGRDQLRMDQVRLEHIAEYAGEDADYTWRLHEFYAPQLAPTGVERLFFDVEMPLVAVLKTMERNGIALDVEHLRRMNEQLVRRLAELVDEIHRLAETSFNPDSPKQLAEVLFDRLKFRVVRTTRTGRSTDAETLEVLAEETGHPLLARLLEYRELQKLRGTYVGALPESLSRRTGRVHTSYHQTGAVTGRLSSSEPNLQNIPIRTELGREIRKAFIPRSPGERLIVADYSQVELRMLAHFSEDEALIRAFAENRDIHAFVASQVNNVALADVTRELRSRAKAVNFGIIYGQTAFGLAQATGMSRTEAQRFIDEYFRRYPRIRGFMDACIAEARRSGAVRTILGRRRPIENIDSRNSAARAQAERFAVNTVVQGSAADLIKLAMIRLHERIEREELPLRMLLQVHDELVCEGPAERMGELCEVVGDVMRHAMPLRVPLGVDVACGLNWLEAK